MTEEKKKKRGRPPETWWDKRFKAYSKACECDAPQHFKDRLEVLKADKQANMIELDYTVMNG